MNLNNLAKIRLTQRSDEEKVIMTQFKKTLLLVLTICSLGILFYYVQQRNVQQKNLTDPAFNTVIGWAQACFNAYPEYDTAIEPDKEPYPQTILPWDLLIGSIDQCITKFIDAGYYQKEKWIDAQIPPQDFLQIISNNTMFRYIEIFLANKPDEAAEMKKIEHEMRMVDTKHPFAQKLHLEPGSKICFFGDIHSSIHSLLRSLVRLVADGFLNDDFTLAQPNHYIICDGDFGDLGRYGSEVLYTLMKLKATNMNRVFLVRGNHDKSAARVECNLIWELKSKYPLQETLNAITRIYRLLPAAIYVGPCKDENNNDVFIQCCHGGIEIGFDPALLLNTANKNQMFQKINAFDESMVQRLIDAQVLDNNVRQDNNIDGFVWSDFKQKLDGKIALNLERKFGYVLDIEAMHKFLKVTNIKAFFRAHQDKHFGLKLFFAEGTTVPENVLKKHSEYPNGPYHWIDVVSADDQANPDGFLVSKYGPVYTFSTAAEGRGLISDCYGIFTTAEHYADWRLKPHEHILPEKRLGYYVTMNLDKKEPNARLINVRFSHIQNR